MRSLDAQDSPLPKSFAGFLAALSQPANGAVDRVSGPPPTKALPWSDELLADDVATLSYEKALRVHARYHAGDAVEDSATIASSDSVDTSASQPQSVPAVHNASEKMLKDASITIRLSREEDAQLRKRAAEAGLTVSAYVRSCTFEAESLRALVKDTLTQFRAGVSAPQADLPKRRPRWSAFLWRGRQASPQPEPKQA